MKDKILHEVLVILSKKAEFICAARILEHRLGPRSSCLGEHCLRFCYETGHGNLGWRFLLLTFSNKVIDFS